MMALSVAERKHRLPHGAMKEIALAEGVSVQTVSRVVGGMYVPQTEAGERSERRIRVRVARKLGMRVDDVFDPRDSEQSATAA